MYVVTRLKFPSIFLVYMVLDALAFGELLVFTRGGNIIYSTVRYRQIGPVVGRVKCW